MRIKTSNIGWNSRATVILCHWPIFLFIFHFSNPAQYSLKQSWKIYDNRANSSSDIPECFHGILKLLCRHSLTAEVEEKRVLLTSYICAAKMEHVVSSVDEAFGSHWCPVDLLEREGSVYNYHIRQLAHQYHLKITE